MKTVFASMTVLVLGATSVSPQEPLAAARELYASAAYEDALDMLGRLRLLGAQVAATDAEVLRAYCLLALRRDTEARSAIEAVVTGQPTFVPGEDEASPRVRAQFREIRRRLLPSIARQLYVAARTDYEQKNAAAASAKFAELLKVLGDEDLGGDESLSDLRLLADGFRTVSLAAASIGMPADATPESVEGATAREGALAPAATPPPASPPAAPPTARAAPAVTTQPVTAAVAIDQQLPPWRDSGSFTRGEFTGAIDLIIDEQGRVESVSLRKSVHPLYDDQLLVAAKTWTYRPARRGDQPIKFHKTLIVRLSNR